VRRVFGSALLLTVALSTTARANGRFPEAQAIVSSGTTLYLRTTFGILVSRDAGKRWRWICERALGYEGEWDPPIAATPDGRLWVGLEDGLVTTPDACHFERVPALAGHAVKDLTTDGDVVWAISAAPDKPGYVWRLDARGAERRARFDATNLMTVEVRGARVYVSGQPYTTIRGRLYRSADGGKTFDEPKPAGADALVADGPLFIGAIDPAEPRRLLLRHLHASGSALLTTDDAGATFATALEMTSAMFGFAAEGATVWAGSGLPEHGLFRSADGGRTFANVAKHGVLCLHAAAGALFVCENTMSVGAPAVAVTRDGAAITPLARFQDVEGPVDCPEARTLCAASWPETLARVTPREAGASRRAEAPPPPRRERCSCEIVGTPEPDVGRSMGWCLALAAAASRRGLRPRRPRRSPR